MLAANIAKENSVFNFFIIWLFSYLPNVILWFILWFKDSSGMRRWYLNLLCFKLFIAAFLLPLVIIRSVSSGQMGLYEGVCG